MKRVTKPEFEEFLKQYPKPLSNGSTMICEPPFRSFRDDTLPTDGERGSVEYYFDKEVAREVMDWGPFGKASKDNWYYMIKEE